MIGVAATGCLAMLGLDVWLLTHTPSWISLNQWLLLMAAAWLFFGGGIWLIRKTPKRTAAALILLGGVALPLAAGFAPPRSSDDLYRYIWDGRVQAAGIDPYRYAPAEPELAGLRDDFLWPRTSAWCVGPETTGLVPGCSLINRPTVHTIYPPAAQAFFAAVHFLSPDGAREWPIQLAATLFAWATTILLLVMLPRRGIDARLAVAWAWCPLVALESGNNAHIDVIGAFLTVVALLILSRAATAGRAALGGAVLALAVAVKITPILAGPAVLRRRPLVVMGAAAAAMVAVYVPHVIAVGPAVLGYIPGYLNEEGYSSGSRFALLTMLVPQGLATAAAVAVLAAVAVAVIWRGDPDRPWHGALVMTGAALLVTTPIHSWYAVLLVAMVALTGRMEWLAVAFAGYVAQYWHELGLSITAAERLGYGLALLTIVAVATRRISCWPRGIAWPRA